MGATLTLMQHVDCEPWRAWSRLFADMSIYQTWEFGARRARESGQEVNAVAVMDGNQPIGLALVRLKRVPILGGGIAHVYRGPVCRPADGGAARYRDVCRALADEFAKARGFTLRVAPPVWDEPQSSEVLSALTEAGFCADAGVELERTIMVDATAPPEELRKRLAQKWRNGLNQAERHGIEVEVATDDAAFAVFESLYGEMWEKKQFETGVSVNTFRELQSGLPSENRQVVLIARHHGAPVAGHVSTLLGDTCIYLLGATNDAGRSVKAAYLLQWKALTLAHERGATWYDLGGIDPAGNAGVYHFKQGLGGREAAFVARHSASPGGARRVIAPLAERAYRALAGRGSS